MLPNILRGAVRNKPIRRFSILFRSASQSPMSMETTTCRCLSARGPIQRIVEADPDLSPFQADELDSSHYPLRGAVHGPNPKSENALYSASQAQKHVTHNEALRLLDAVVHLSVKSRNRAEAPETPVSGDRYLVAAAAAGAWAGKGGAIASFIDGGWLFVTAAIGWQAYVEDEAQLIVFDGAFWKGVSSVPENLSLSMLGVHATADAVNRLAISSDASLFNNAGQAIR